MLKQLSIFAENVKGAMHKMTQILQENDINILGSVTNDSAEYCTYGGIGSRQGWQGINRSRISV